MKENSFFGSVRKRPGLTAYIAFFIVCVVFVIYVAAAERPNVFSSRTSTGLIILQESSYEKVEDDRAPLGYYFSTDLTLDKAFHGEIYLVYRMVHEYTRVLIDGKTVYSMNASSHNAFGKTIGNCWGMVPLYQSDIGKTVEVRIYPVYRGVESLPDEFILGEKSEIIGREARLGATSFILGALAIIVGIIYIIVSRLGKFSMKESGTALRCLGFFSVLLGAWRVSDMRIMSLMMPNASIALSYITLLSLLLLPFPLSMYIWTKLRLGRRSLHIVSAAFLAVGAAVMIMQLTGIRDVRENLLLIHLSDIAAMALVLILVIWAGRRGKIDTLSGLNIWEVLIVFAGIAADLIEYYFVNSDRNMFWTVLCVDIYVLVTGIQSIIRMRREASIDAATGIYNKNRCQERINAQGPAPEGTMFIMCDLNGLKHVNDTMGHESGDKMISEFSDVLKETFGRERDFIGRFGGDEFIVILDNVYTNEQAGQQLERLQENAAEKRAENPEVPLSFACGYCCEFENRGEDLEYLLRRADMYMYLNKRKWYDDNHIPYRTDRQSAGPAD